MRRSSYNLRMRKPFDRTVEFRLCFESSWTEIKNFCVITIQTEIPPALTEMSEGKSTSQARSMSPGRSAEIFESR